MKKRATDSELMTLRQIEQESGVPYTSVRDMVLTGHLPHVKLGDSRRFWVRRKDYRRMVDGQLSAPGSDRG